MIRKASKNDAMTIAGLAALMWDSHSVEELADDFAVLLSRDDARIFLQYENDIPVGFAQCQLRHDYVEGTETTPVGYLEGIYTVESCRNKGYARALLRECEMWAKASGCTEFASDCEIGNDDSFRFHKAMDFEEANRIICFTKKL
ncbi:MAG: GNAT family N-acetyltransferase [Lachnospiraceae bacterium]|nr:GNAT family N-acetyltransferase [Lachnospiraceae bacterium]MDE6939750.1 GNAT family N-acetyltransferase [Lachnospiraceae bacterium]